MESDERDKSRQLQKVKDLQKQKGLPQNYEGYQTQTHITKQNIILEKSKRVRTTERSPTHPQQRSNNLKDLNLPDFNNERNFLHKNRRVETDSNENLIATYDPVTSNRTDVRSLSNSARYNMHDKNQQYGMYSPNYKDNSGSINQDSRKTYRSNEQPNKNKIYKQPNFELLSIPNNICVTQPANDTSLICRAVNFHGEPVTLNDKVITDKLILSCKPRHYPTDVTTPEVSISKKKSIEEQVNNYIYPADNISSIKSPRESIKDQELKCECQYSHTGTLPSSIPTQSGKKYEPSHSSRNKGVPGTQSKSVGASGGYCDYRQFKEIECRHFYHNFKNFLWALFVINTLLLSVGIILALFTLYYHIFREYLSIVIDETGFVTWMWIVLFIAILIIIVGVFGIITSLVRTKTTLKTYLVLAVILLAVLILVIIIFLAQWSTLKKEAMSGTERTFHLYRCVKRIRVAWDRMMEVFQCCGKDASSDWKYIPPSCCSATSRAGKLACIGHFIQPAQSFETGCKPQIRDYYFFLYLVVLILLFAAILLLIIGILCAFKLHQMFSNILICQDLYYVKNL